MTENPELSGAMVIGSQIAHVGHTLDFGSNRREVALSIFALLLHWQKHRLLNSAHPMARRYHLLRFGSWPRATDAECFRIERSGFLRRDASVPTRR